jgi:hypothetical protein
MNPNLPRFYDFDDALSIDENGFLFAKIYDYVIIFGGTHISRIVDLVMNSVIETHAKRSKRISLYKLLDFLHLHSLNSNSTGMSGKRNSIFA